MNMQDTIEEMEIDLSERRDRDILQDNIIVNQKNVIEKMEGGFKAIETENKDLNVWFCDDNRDRTAYLLFLKRIPQTAIA
jgi:hypothetical protein